MTGPSDPIALSPEVRTTGGRCRLLIVSPDSLVTACQLSAETPLIVLCRFPAPALTTDEQYKSVLLRAAAKLNELADRQGCRLSPTATEPEITKPACDSRNEEVPECAGSGIRAAHAAISPARQSGRYRRRR
jgi:hypothetical protein